MSNLLYSWNFTSNTTSSNALNNIVYDDKSNLMAQVISRNTISSSSVSQDEYGITLDNNDTDAGICIDLSGLDSVNLGGDITIEMVIKNTELNKNTIYFQTIGDVSNNDSAFVTAKFNNNTRLTVRTSSYDESGYNFRNVSDSTNNVNNTDFFHYVFTVSYSSENSSIKIFINGVEKGENISDLTQELTSTLRESNLIGCQKNPLGTTYLKGTVKYLKIYQNAMSSSDILTVYNDYNNAPFFSNYSSKTDSEKYTRRHSNVNTYFTDNPSITLFKTQGNQIGLINNNETYSVHKFTNGSNIDISEGYHYIPLSGQNNFIIFENGSTFYKITQTSADNGSSTIYKYEISNDSGGNYGDAITGKTFGETFTDGNITIGFGGAESGVSIHTSNICFLGDALVQTDQGKIPIKNITCNNTIFGLKVHSLVKVKNIYNYMILFKKNSLGPNIPSIDTFVSKNHLIFVNNTFIKAISLVNGKNIIKKIRGQDIMYNLLFNKYYAMIVNNMIVETLDPKNKLAKKYLTKKCLKTYN